MLLRWLNKMMDIELAYLYAISTDNEEDNDDSDVNG